ncbi:MAG TPA: DNA-3-methyladenine glycosylase [Candidatus Saccharimonadales bacterium]|nr:DNA-3-methyladenine glycosylase [Candidatus Saccharimonadales bacterium]
MDVLSNARQHLAAADPILARVITSTNASPPFTGHTNYYQALVDSIISQQLSVKAAAAIEARFKNLFENDFPSPEQIIEKDDELLRSVGISRPKVRYIKDLAQHILDGTVRFDMFDSLDNEAIIQELTQVKGIGEWTAHMFLMFCMRRLDVLPVGDLGIRNGIQRLYKLPNTPSPEMVIEIASQRHWHPYESVASWYVWHSLDNAPKV